MLSRVLQDTAYPFFTVYSAGYRISDFTLSVIVIVIVIYVMMLCKEDDKSYPAGYFLFFREEKKTKAENLYI